MPADVRKPPVRAVTSQHKQGVRGLCGWCGLAVEEKTEVRGYLKYWHDACDIERSIIEQPAMARYYVEKRDHGICCDCGEDWSQMSVFRPANPTGAHHPGDDPDPDRYSPGPKPGTWCIVSHRGGAPYIELLVISLWHVDHKVPLWKVRHMPDLQRLEYFKLANLITRCHRCHAFKTRKEAADRAKFNDQGDPEPEPEKPKRKWSSRPMGKRPAGAGNGFPPRGSTPMRKKS